METQTKLDFDRAEQLAILRLADVPNVAGKVDERGREIDGVTSPKLRLILRVIDDHGRGRVCWLAFETIAVETGISPRQCKRAVAALVELGLLISERRRNPAGTVCNHYVIVWSELALLCRKRVQTRPTKVPPEQSKVPPQPTKVPPATDQSAASGTLTDPEAHQEPPPEPAEGRAAAVDLLTGLKIRSAKMLVEDLTAKGTTLEDITAAAQVAAAVLRIPANRRLFQNPPGAAAYFLRFGDWPAAGVIDPEAHTQAIAARRAKLLAADRQTAAWSIIKTGRRLGKTDAEITERLTAAGLQWD